MSRLFDEALSRVDAKTKRKVENQIYFTNKIHNMKEFVKKFLARSSTKWMLIFVCFFVSVWTFFWSMQVGHFHWGPLMIGTGFIVFVFGMSWLMRNNP